MIKNKYKRLLTLFCAAAVTVTVLPQITMPQAEAKAQSDSGLKWDFEDKSDFAYTVAHNTDAYVMDAPNSGAWVREWPAETGAFSWRHRALQKATSEVSSAPTGCGSYCLHLNQNDGTWRSYSLGTGIMLTELELVPGREYTISADVMWTHTRNDSPVRSLYLGFSKPSQRIVTDQWAAKSPWQRSGVYQKMTLTGGGTSLTSDSWTKASATFTASEDMYENGNIMLYLSIARADLNSGQPLGQEQAYLDNVTIVPANHVADKVAVSEVNYGRAWDFEEGSGIPGRPGGGQDAVFAQTYSEGYWSLLNETTGDSWFRGPRITSIADAKMYISGYSDTSKNQTEHGTEGAAAPDSDYCIRMTIHNNYNVNWNKGILGTRIRITKDEFGTGQFDIRAYSGFTARADDAGYTSTKYKLFAAVFDGEQLVPDMGNSNTDFSNITAVLNEANAKVDLGYTNRWWSRNGGTITITDACYDENGVATLVLYAQNEAGVSQMEPGLTLYLDDISLTRTQAYELLPGNNISFYYTGISDVDLGEGLLIAALKDGDSLKECSSYSGNLGYVSRKSFNVKVPEDAENPEVRLYIWDKNRIRPLSSSIKAGLAFEEIEIECEWSADWTDVLGTRCDEAANPTVQADNQKTALLIIEEKDEIEMTVTVYDANEDVYSQTSGKGSLNVNVPATDDYSVNITAKNLTNTTRGTVGNYTKSEFEALVNHIVPTIAETGRLTYRSSFEHDYIGAFSTTNAAQWKFSDKSPNSGDKCLYVYGRYDANDMLQLTSGELLDAEKIQVSAYFRNDDNASSQIRAKFYAVVPLADGTSTTLESSQFRISTDGAWCKAEAEFDLSALSVATVGAVKIQVYSAGKPSFYIDDFVVTADCSGTHNDDMLIENYILQQKSSTAYETTAAAGVEEDIPALKDVFKDYFKVGATTQTGALFGDSEYNVLLNKHFNTTSADGCFKRTWIQREEKTGKSDLSIYDFGAADKMMKICYDTGMTDVVGHALVWDMPDLAWTNQDADGNWVDRDTALARMKEYITKVMNHFNGKGDASEYASGIDYSDWHVPAWDVVNEAAWHSGSGNQSEDGVYWQRKGGHINTIGKDYVYYAFQYAREADPTAELRYNDFDDLSSKTDRIVQIVKDVNATDRYYNGKPLIDTIGYQCHFVQNVSVEHATDAVKKFIGCGTKVDITEMDVSAYSFAGGSEFADGVTKMREFEQAMIWKDFFEVLKENADDINRVNLWTFTDKYCYEAKSYRGIFDFNYKAKPQYWAIVLSEEEFYEKYPEAKALFKKTRWSFDKETDITWDVDMGSWTRSSPQEYSIQPKIEADGEYLVVPAPDWTARNNKGIRIKLSTEQLEIGKTYTLSYKAKIINGNNVDDTGNNYYAALAKPSVVIGDWDSPATFLTSTTPVGTTSTEWQTYTKTLVPTAADFENGYTVLYITTSGSCHNSKLCFDDISIE